MKKVNVVAWPKSGTTWAVHLLCDMLNSPQGGEEWDEPKYWGPGRGGGYLICKHHKRFTKEFAKSGIVVFVRRDPRDIAVSASHYLGMGILEAMREMPLMPHYLDWMYPWLEYGDRIDLHYEDLSGKDYVGLLAWLDREIQGKWLDKERYEQIYQRQSFANMRRQLNNDTHFMRKGIVGDWRNHFDRDIAKRFNDEFGEFMLEQGYVDSLDWWQKL